MVSAPSYFAGTQGFGTTWKADNVEQLIRQLDAHGIKRYDTAALYPATNPGETERILGNLHLSDGIIDTKILFSGPGALSKENMGTSIKNSLTRLQVDKIHTLYAHAPDKATSIAEQAANFDHFYRSGLYEKLGLCNYSPDQVSEWLAVAKEKNYILPSVYQGQYNVLCRTYEDTLFPLLREHGIVFVANSPLAGGFLTGKLTFSTSSTDLIGTRFEVADENIIGGLFRMWYDKPVFHEAVRKLQQLAESQQITTAEAAMRWLLFHSPLNETDGVIIGPSNISQLESYLQARQAGPLRSDIAQAIGDMSDRLKAEAAPFVEVGWWSG